MSPFVEIFSSLQYV